jgi:DNA primase
MFSISPTILAWEHRAVCFTLAFRSENHAMGEDLEQIKQRVSLVEYLQQQNWTGRPVSHGGELVGFCPLHSETRPSFYVNVRKNLFYCHGCGHGGDLIRFVELSRHLSFRQTVTYLGQQKTSADPAEVLKQACVFYQRQLEYYPEARGYLQQRGLHDPALIRELQIGYAPGASLRRHLLAQGYSLDLLQHAGVVNPQGCDTLYQRIVFPCCQDDRIVNLYGRGIANTAFPHRFLSGSKGDLVAWKVVREFSTVILVEGMFDVAVLWQAGFRNTTCSLGTHLTPRQVGQLCDRRRTVYLAFDVDDNGSGQQAAQDLARRLEVQGTTTRRVFLPSGHDPNSFFVQGGNAQQFNALLEAAQS